MAALSTKALVQQLKDGERRACAHLVERYQALLVREAMRVFSLRRDDAQEVASDVLLAVVNGIHDFTFKRGDGDFHLWVMAIFRNKVRDLVRQQAVRGMVVELDSGALVYPSGDGHSSDSERLEYEVARVAFRKYQEALVQHMDGVVESDGDYEETGPVARKLVALADALERLEAWERVLLRCRALDVPYEEIASYTGKPVSHLKVYHARVRKKFVRILAEYFPELTEHEQRLP